MILLDKVQNRICNKHKENQVLKKLGLVDGRYPNLYVSAKVAAATDQKAKHIRDGGFNRQYYLDMIAVLIRKYGPVPREEIDRLLVDKLPEVLSSDQKTAMIHNLLTALRQTGLIRNKGSRRFPQWIWIDGNV